ncbi:hypothetical protein C8R42DRAFT_692175 [Lentinula raphanica]|nr:hypothetical protein C8R42DRAFT_692175 [Lentinula raphanica]
MSFRLGLGAFLWLYIHRAQKSEFPSNISQSFTNPHGYSRVSTFATLSRIKTNRQLGQISSLANARGYMSTKDFVHLPSIIIIYPLITPNPYLKL